MKAPKCPQCTEPTTIYVGMGSATLMWSAPFYDASGRFHQHDPNTYTQEYRCANGHVWTEKTAHPCWCEGKEEA